MAFDRNLKEDHFMVVPKKKKGSKSSPSNSHTSIAPDLDQQTAAVMALKEIEASRNAIAAKLANEFAAGRRQELFASLANNLVMARNARGFTQAELADIAGVSRATIAQIENGTGDPHLSTFSAISSALDVSPLLLLLTKHELIGIADLIKNPEPVNNLATGISAEDKELMKLLIQSGLGKNQKRAAEMGSASIVKSGLVFKAATGAGIGAAIGTVLLPGIGTAIGASLGSLFSTIIDDRTQP
jgi:transcriptional regulator with XRE-family HTH domain